MIPNPVLLHFEPHAACHAALATALGGSNASSFHVLWAPTGQVLARLLATHQPFVVIFSFDALKRHQKRTSISLVRHVKSCSPQTIVLIYTPCESPTVLHEALAWGADDAFALPLPTTGAAFQTTLLPKLCALRSSTPPPTQTLALYGPKPGFVVGHSMKSIASRVPRIVNSAIRFVYVEGESGTGKEVVADLFAHYVAPAPFIKLNCGTIPENLLESALFGHKKGSFTGALFDKMGVIEAANGGWLFLDEVASLSSAAQTALLRALENQEITPIGDHRPRSIQVRVVVASNKPLSWQVTRGLFRNDLWQRLREAEIHLIPLRQRAQEIPQFLHNFCQRMEGGPYELEPAASRILERLPWQEGNVRELRNCLRAMTEHQNQRLLPAASIPARLLAAVPVLSTRGQQKEEQNLALQIHPRQGGGRALTWAEWEHAILGALIQRSQQEDGRLNITKLSKELGLSRSTLQHKLKLFHQQDLA